MPPRLRTVLLISNLAVLALPVGGFWGLRLYESALVRQTESELVAQAAVLASVFREQMHILSDAPSPLQPSAAALHMAGRPGLDLATDPVLPPQPDDVPGTGADPSAGIAGLALIPVLRDAQLVTLASMRITDRNGVIVATTGGDLGRSLSAWPEVARVLAGEPVVSAMHRRDPVLADYGGLSRTAGLRVFVALAVAGPADRIAGAVVLSRTPNSLGAAIWGKRRALTGLSLLLVAGGTALAAGISVLVTRPIGEVVKQARAVAAGAAVPHPTHPRTREVAELSEAITLMAATLEQRARYIVGFAASVSHEFKTPMAAIKAAAELLDDGSGTLQPEDRQHLLGVVSDGVVRLERLVRRLVELARADMTRVANAATEVGPVLRRVADRYLVRGMAISLSCDEGAVALPADALDAMVTSLLDNAAAHAAGAGVTVTSETKGGEVRITVRDSGPGIREADRDRVFEPFFTTGRAAGGTGLGLPIVRAIASGGGGSVNLLPGDSGAAFLVRLPAAA